MNDLKARGVEDILIAVVDGLKGFPEAIEAVFPQAAVQTCIVHLIRNSLDFASWKDRKPVVAELRKIYRADRRRGRPQGPGGLREQPMGPKIYRQLAKSGGGSGSRSSRSSPSLRRSGKSSTPRMRSTSDFCGGLLFSGRASDLVTKRGVSAASAARRPTRSLPE